MNTRAPSILDHLSALADTTRSRILLLLDRRELTVSELCGVMQLPQSTVSRHLKALADGGWVTARGEGTSNLYTMTRTDLDQSAKRLWHVVREEIGDTPAAEQDQRRLQRALAERRSKSQEFFSASASQWDRVRAELFGDGFHFAAGEGRAGAVRRARGRRRRVGGDAAGGAQASAGARQRRSPAWRHRGAAD